MVAPRDAGITTQEKAAFPVWDRGLVLWRRDYNTARKFSQLDAARKEWFVDV